MIVGLFDDPMLLTMIGSVVTYANTIPIPIGAVDQNCWSPVAQSTASVEGSIEGDKTCNLNFRAWDVVPGPLANNGGPTETLMPSNNRYFADNDLESGVTTDQCGAPR